MIPLALLAAAISAAPAESPEISTAVRAVVSDHRGDLGLAAERQLAALASAGDQSAAAVLSELLHSPRRAGGPDHQRACNYDEASVAYAQSLQNLATCYFKGHGRPRDLAKAREFYGRAADAGVVRARCALGNLLIHGNGGPADVPRGLALCRDAADGGEVEAQADYGDYLLTGQFMQKDAVEARRYLSLAAEKGQPNAAYHLGQIYWNGDGVEKDLNEAAKWWRVSHDGGRADAANKLGAVALRKISAELRASRPVPAALIADAKLWFGIAAEKDPNPDERRKASEAFRLISELESRSN